MKIIVKTAVFGHKVFILECNIDWCGYIQMPKSIVVTFVKFGINP